jgi:hypothetical protein
MIPNTVASIGDWAFYECTSLTSVIIPNNVTNIGEWALGYCTSLTNVTIGPSVSSIGASVFWTTNLGSPAFWTTVSPAPVVVQGRNAVSNVISGAQQFYRLSQ